MINFRTLKADEIECRVGQINEEGFTLLLYKDARCDMNILDETVGCFHWQRDHKEVKGNLYGGVSIYIAEENHWVTKWDCGTESREEKEKGESSDSFKRACVNWGIGRELYTAPIIKIKGNVKKNSKGKLIPSFWNIEVSKIDYNDKREISLLEIKGDKKVIYSFGCSAKVVQEEDDQPPTDRQIEEFKILGGDIYKLAEALKKDVEDLNFVDLDWAIGQKKARAKK